MSEKQKYFKWLEEEQESGLISISFTLEEEVNEAEDLYRAINEFIEKTDTTEPRF